ncbi:MAG: hypothetical protein WAM82_25345 [Thermoanaerobaculia bacterium]
MNGESGPDAVRRLTSEGALRRGGVGWIGFLSRVGVDPEGELAFEARNFLLDEGIPSLRVDSYAESGAMVDHPTVEAWQGAHVSYLSEKVFRLPSGDGLPRALDPLDEISCPETFRLLDSEAPFLHTDPRLHLVRVERLDFVADLAGVDASTLREIAEAVVGSRDPDAVRRLNDILGTWERGLEVRPIFAAFLDDVADLFGPSPADDPLGWADTLRDCLGLFHYDPGVRKATLEILVFRYPVSIVPKLRGLERERRPLVPPTVLDSRLSPAFLPAPRASTTGHVVDLSAEARSLRREVLHPGIPFEAKHLWRVGAIVRPVAPENLSVARGVHISMVQAASSRLDYASGTDGDLL